MSIWQWPQPSHLDLLHEKKQLLLFFGGFSFFTLKAGKLLCCTVSWKCSSPYQLLYCTFLEHICSPQHTARLYFFTQQKEAFIANPSNSWAACDGKRKSVVGACNGKPGCVFSVYFSPGLLVAGQLELKYTGKRYPSTVIKANIIWILIAPTRMKSLLTEIALLIRTRRRIYSVLWSAPSCVFNAYEFRDGVEKFCVKP